MNDNWVKVYKTNAFYTIELWKTDESRIASVTKRSYRFGRHFALAKARRYAIEILSDQIIKFRDKI